MNVLRSILIAISMYSKIPTPQVKWEEKAMQYSFCFFPIVGIIVGVVNILWWYVAEWLQLGSLFYGAVAAVLPLLITGGIHMDGFMDTCDAKHSYQPRERRLEIMKDPHLGAFAVIMALIYMVVYVGAASEVTTFKMCLLVSLGFVLSRAFSSMAFAWFEPAKKEGLFYTFKKSANKKAILLAQSLTMCAVTIALVWVDVVIGLVMLLGAAAVFLYYRAMSKKLFGGVTGDLAGYFLQCAELILLLIVVIMSKLME